MTAIVSSRRHHRRFRHRRFRHRRGRRNAVQPPPSLRVTELLAPGRSTITLRGLRAGLTYRLLLTVTGAEGELVSDVATLTMRAR